jgi:copper chaperone
MMDMKKQQFKTNVKCGACVAAITPEMEKLNTKWEVDLTHADRILTVEGEVSEEKVKAALTQAGYQAEALPMK